MDREALLTEAIEYQKTHAVTLTEAISATVRAWLQRVAGTWTARAEQEHRTDVMRLAEARGHALY